MQQRLHQLLNFLKRMSGIKQYITKDGRTYHDEANIPYMLPTDSKEIPRLFKQHEALKGILDGRFKAPLQDKLEAGITVLDSGCGPGAWLLDMANTYKNSQFHGIDIHADHFLKEGIPANAHFVIGDLAENIPYPDNTFDFIYQRLLILGLTTKQWESNLQELYRVLKPGGYIELTEIDCTRMHTYGPYFKKLQEVTDICQRARGTRPHIAVELFERANKAGFINVKDNVINKPFCHGGEIGELTRFHIISAHKSFSPHLIDIVPEWKDANIYQEYIKNCEIEAATNKVYAGWNVVTAQKPIDKAE